MMQRAATAWPPCSCQCSAWRRNGGQCVANVCMLQLACAWPGLSLVVPVPGQASAWRCLSQCVIQTRDPANCRETVRAFTMMQRAATAWPPCSCQCSAWRRNGGQCVANVCMLQLACAWPGLSLVVPVPGQASAWWCLCLARPQPGGACAWPGISLVVPVPGQASAWWCLPQCVI